MISSAPQPMPPRPSLPAIFLAALRLGCTSFGGPVAHLAYFRREYVERRHWLDEAHYADLVALCQFLPGPSSSQVGFGIGLLQRGLAGGIAAWLGFTLPSAALMIGFGCGLHALGPLAASGWLQGLKLAAVAVVAQAVLAMWRALCPDAPRSVLAVAAAAMLLLMPTAWSQLAVIVVGALLGWRWLPGPSWSAPPVREGQNHHTPSKLPGAVALGLFFVLLVALPAAARYTGRPALEVAAQFFRAGALVFGGGHVVLPLLQSGIVAPGWVGHDPFLAGYGSAQALPGPLFTFAGFLGTVMSLGPGGWVGGLWALAWIFMPGLLLVFGVLPWWQGLRARPAMQSALRGTNAAVVGLLLAALIYPIGTVAWQSAGAAALALAAFAALHVPRVPPWAVVLTAAALGGWLF
ncbi:MAG: chromate efflux transporter [Opitutales bacterium]